MESQDEYSEGAKVFAYAILPARPPWLPDPCNFECSSNKAFKDNIALLPCFPLEAPIVGGHIACAAGLAQKRRKLNDVKIKIDHNDVETPGADSDKQIVSIRRAYQQHTTQNTDAQSALTASNGVSKEEGANAKPK